MPSINQREASRKEWRCTSTESSATESEIRTGSLQCIADALERIANDRQADRARADRLERANAQLRGQLRREKSRATVGQAGTSP
jgi:hypothetical protein